MTEIVLVGADGAGKTTIAKRLVSQLPIRAKYLYMGWTTQSSNFSLPTSRLIQTIRRFYEKNFKKNFVGSSIESESKYLNRKVFTSIDKQNSLVSTIRLFHRLANDSYIQCISWIYQFRGYLVISDRHFIFEATFKYYSKNDKQRLTIRLHRWLLDNVYVKPDLVILLDAPPDVLYKRKKEETLDILKIRRDVLSNYGRIMPNTVQIDSSQPLEIVYNTVSDKIMKFLNL
jgi:thymidylate kinase